MTMKIPNWNKLVETIGVEGIMELVNRGTYEASVREQGTCTYDRTYRVSLSLDELFGEDNIQEMINDRWDEDSIMDWFYDNANIIDEAISYGEETRFDTDDWEAEDYDWNTVDGSRLNTLVEAIIDEQ